MFVPFTSGRRDSAAGRAIGDGMWRGTSPSRPPLTSDNGGYVDLLIVVTIVPVVRPHAAPITSTLRAPSAASRVTNPGPPDPRSPPVARIGLATPGRHLGGSPAGTAVLNRPAAGLVGDGGVAGPGRMGRVLLHRLGGRLPEAQENYLRQSPSRQDPGRTISTKSPGSALRAVI